MAKFTPKELNILRIAPDIVTGLEHHSHMLVFNLELDHSASEKIFSGKILNVHYGERLVTLIKSLHALLKASSFPKNVSPM